VRNLFVALVYFSFFIVGASAPFIFALGYVWVDTFYPQYVTDGLLTQIPISFLMAIAAIGGYFLADRRSPPKFNLSLKLILLFAVWTTITLSWAVVPADAWFKWGWAFKSVLFAVFIPYVFRTRVQIEAFILVFYFSCAATFIPTGLKTLMNGGGYGMNLGLIQGHNVGLSESSFQAAAAIAFIPILVYLREYSLIIPPLKTPRLMMFAGLIVADLACSLGTFARTAIIGVIILVIPMWLQSRRKILFALLAAVAGVGILTVATSPAWENRISTIGTYNKDSSAYTRILMWMWTLKFVGEHPLGGGFNSHEISVIEMPSLNGEPGYVEKGRAFHNMYFEVLGEHGFPGLAIFLLILFRSLMLATQVVRRTRNRPDLVWACNLGKALRTSLMVMMACANFIGIGFQPVLWYFIALPICLREYVRRVERDELAVKHGATDPAAPLAPLAGSLP